jgi:hypothetical protein
LFQTTKPVLIFFKQSISTPDKEFCEVAIINDENEITYVHMTGIIDENGACHISVIDITEHKLMEIELIKAKEWQRPLLLLKLIFSLT